MKIFFSLIFLFASFGIFAEIKELAPGLTIDTSSYFLKTSTCGAENSGMTCITQCYNIDNKTKDTAFICNIQAKATFTEQLNLTDGTIHTTGKTLTSTDYKSVWIYPHQVVSICFNFGKEFAKLPNDPNTNWKFSHSEISGEDGVNPECIGGAAGPVEIKP